MSFLFDFLFDLEWPFTYTLSESRYVFIKRLTMNDDGVGKDDSKRSFSQDYVANVYAAAAALIRRCTSMRPTENTVYWERPGHSLLRDGETNCTVRISTGRIRPVNTHPHGWTDGWTHTQWQGEWRSVRTGVKIYGRQTDVFFELYSLLAY